MNIPYWNSLGRVERVLLCLAVFLLLFFLILPIFVKPLPQEKPILEQQGASSIRLGTIRASYQQKPRRVVVIDMTLILQSPDTGFSDEVVSKKARLKSLAAQYVQVHAGQGGILELEPVLAAGLRDTLNGILYLGRIESVVFERFEILE